MKLLIFFSVIILNKRNKFFRRIWGSNTEPFVMKINTYPQRHRGTTVHRVF